MAEDPWSGKGLVSALKAVLTAGLVGGVSYGLLYLAYFQIYGPIGLRPRDLGYDRLRLLEESLIGLVAAPILAFRVYPRQTVLAVVVIAALLTAGVAIHRYHAPVQSWRRDLVAALSVVLVGVVVAAVVLVGSAYLTAARALGREIRGGGGALVTSEVFVGRTYLFPYLDVQSLPFRLTATGDASAIDFNSGCTVFLGANDEHLVLYDTSAIAVLRVPREGFALVSYPQFRSGPLPAPDSYSLARSSGRSYLTGCEPG